MVSPSVVRLPGNHLFFFKKNKTSIQYSILNDQRSLSKTVATRDEVSIHITQSLACMSKDDEAGLMRRYDASPDVI